MIYDEPIPRTTGLEEGEMQKEVGGSKRQAKNITKGQAINSLVNCIRNLYAEGNGKTLKDFSH